MKLSDLFTGIELKEWVDSFKVKQSPTAPKGMVEFRGFNKYEKRQESSRFHSQPHIQSYLDDKWKVEVYNRDCFLKIIEMRDYLLREKLIDLSQESNINKKLGEIKTLLGDQQFVFTALRIDYSKYNTAEPEVEVDWDN